MRITVTLAKQLAATFDAAANDAINRGEQEVDIDIIGGMKSLDDEARSDLQRAIDENRSDAG